MSCLKRPFLNCKTVFRANLRAAHMHFSITQLNYVLFMHIDLVALFMASTGITENDVTTKNEATEAAKRFDYVRFTFADMHGIARSKMVARRNFHEFFADGIALFSGRDLSLGMN